MSDKALATLALVLVTIAGLAWFVILLVNAAEGAFDSWL